MIEAVLGLLGASLVVALYGASAAGPLGAAAAAIYVVGFDVLHLVFARRTAARLRRASASGEPGRAVRVFWLVALQWAGLAGALIGGWAGVVGSSPLRGTYVLEPLVLIVPWLLVHVSWLLRRRTVHDAQGRSPWPLGGYLSFHLRLLVIPALPSLLLHSLSWLETAGGRFPELLRAYPSLQFAVVMASSVLLVALSPFLLRLAFGGTSMPDGTLRRRFESLARRAGFRYLDIRVCPTNQQIMNAAFVGILGRLRYVLMTDAILRRLSEDDLVGVFAHEMGHSMRRHIVLNLVLMTGFAASMQLVTRSWGDPVGLADPQLVSLLPLIALPAFFLLVFSPVARSFEIEADVYAGEVLGDPGPIMRSLDRLGWIYPDKRKKGGFIHPSIEVRVGFLDTYFQDAEVRAAFKSRMKRLRTGILVFAAVPLLIWGALLPQELTSGAVLDDAMVAVRTDDAALAARTAPRLEDLVAEGFSDSGGFWRMQLWQVVATARQDEGDLEAAEPWVELMRANTEEFDGPLETYNAAIIIAQQEAAKGNWPQLVSRLRTAHHGLDPLAKLFGEDDPQIDRERRDIRFLGAGVTLLRRVGALPPGEVFPAPRGDDDGARFRTLDLLGAAVEEGSVTTSGALPGPPPEEGVPAWRRRFLEALRTTLSRHLRKRH